MAASGFKHEWTLDLPKLTAAPYQKRNLCVQMERCNSSWRAVLIDLTEFRGSGSTEAMAIDDLADELEHVAAEIRRESGKAMPDLEWSRAIYVAALRWRQHVNLVPATRYTQQLIAVIDAAIADEERSSK